MTSSLDCGLCGAETQYVVGRNLIVGHRGGVDACSGVIRTVSSGADVAC